MRILSALREMDMEPFPSLFGGFMFDTGLFPLTLFHVPSLPDAFSTICPMSKANNATLSHVSTTYIFMFRRPPTCSHSPSPSLRTAAHLALRRRPHRRPSLPPRVRVHIPRSSFWFTRKKYKWDFRLSIRPACEFIIV